MHDDFKLEEIAITPEETAELHAKQRKLKAARRDRFVLLPLSWVDRLTRVSGSIYRVAVYLRHQHWKCNGQPTRLTNVSLRGVCVSRASKDRALQDLENLGLICVARHPRQSPLVTIVLEP